jgi:hypothetical protein
MSRALAPRWRWPLVRGGRGDRIDTDAPSALSELAAIDGIPIAEQMAGLWDGKTSAACKSAML